MNAAEALDGIRAGGGNMLIVARGRCNDVIAHIEEGNFGAAMLAAQQLVNKLGHLHHAQAALGLLAEGHVVLAKDVEVGMWLADPEGGVPGEVIDAGPCPCDTPGCGKVLIVVGDTPWQLSPHSEMFAVEAPN